MCLHINRLLTDRFVRLHKVGHKTRYKVLLKSLNGLSGPFYYHSYKPGWNNSGVQKSNKMLIHEGMHVFNSLTEAKNMCERLGIDRHVVVKVKCCNKDFLGMDKYESAYTKIWLSKDEYKKALCSFK